MAVRLRFKRDGTMAAELGKVLQLHRNLDEQRVSLIETLLIKPVI